MTPPTPDLRRDPITGLWTVVTPGRTRRPAAPEPGAPAPACPFCEGNESMTPPEVDALRPDGGGADGPGWTLRVVPNKFPVFPDGHEVVIHSPRHEAALHELSDEAVAATLDAARRRLRTYAAGGAAAGLVAVNQGAGAGASLAHPHAQLFALPIVPAALAAEVDAFAGFAAKGRRCLLCDVVARVREGGDLLVHDGDVVAWTPDASRYPYEVWLAPARHTADFCACQAQTLAALAAALKRALAAVDEVTGGAPLNWWLHTVPFGAQGPFHWHLELAPRTTALAAFELGTGIAIDVVEPRDAAARLRAAGGRDA
jgi:UDPglucose--hexose-1-phosphate uridylyltransferase